MTNQTEQGAADLVRAAFEAWASSQNWVIDRDSFGDYLYGSVRDGWDAYRAGVAEGRRQIPTSEGYTSVATEISASAPPSVVRAACGCTAWEQQHCRGERSLYAEHPSCAKIAAERAARAAATAKDKP